MLDSYAEVYHVFKEKLTPPEVDLCEVWQLAALAGLHVEQPAATGGDQQPNGVTPSPAIPESFADRARVFLETGVDPALALAGGEGG